MHAPAGYCRPTLQNVGNRFSVQHVKSISTSARFQAVLMQFFARRMLSQRTTFGLWMAPRCVQSARMTPSAASRVDVSAAPGRAISTPSTTCRQCVAAS